MVVPVGVYTFGFLAAAVCVFLLSYVTYQLLKNYLHNWKELKPVPGIGYTYPFIGNALQLKSNAGGEKDLLLSNNVPFYRIFKKMCLLKKSIIK